MEWLESAGWTYDPESDSIESVDFQKPYFMIISIALFLSPLPFIQLGKPTGDRWILFVFTLIAVLAISSGIGKIASVNGSVRRISLSDLSYTVMRRNKDTKVNSKINRLESKKDFIHENLAVILYEYSVAQRGGTERTVFEIRLVDKTSTKGLRYFGEHSLPPELKCNSIHLAFNIRVGPAHDLQRILVRDAGSKERGFELRDKFHEFFIEKGWENLSRNAPINTSTENPSLSSEAFW